MTTTRTVSSPDITATGIRHDDGSSEFRGLRYATAPRFGAPVDSLAVSGQSDATTWGPMCAQNPGFLEAMAGYDASSASEDCLRLNIFCPADTDADSKLPVLFWIHGGAYLTGAGSLGWYHGGNLAERGAVVVTINYRLGALGYLGETNLGTLDQISALRWVSRNIGAFGGNPDNVTVFGESAGGSAIVALMAAPDAAGLFHRAWAMSPSIGQLRSRERGLEAQQSFLALSGADSIGSLLDMSIEELLVRQAEQIVQPSSGYDHFSPTAGGAGLPDDILGTAARNPVPFVVGSTRDEDKLFSAFNDATRAATLDDWHKRTTTVFADKAAEARAIYEARRGGEPWELISALATDTAFRQPAIRLASARAALGNPTWMYWFTHSSTSFGGRFGSCHALDLPFAFGTLDADGAEALTGASDDHAGVADRFGHELLSLARDAHPSWAQYDAATRSTLEISARPTLLDDPESEIRRLFE